MQYFEDINQIYGSFDHHSQNLWAHSDLFPSEIKDQYFHGLQAKATEIEEIYDQLIEIKKGGGYANNITDIRDLKETLARNCGLFSIQVKELHHEIAKARRQAYQSSQKRSGEFHEFIPLPFSQELQSLKA